MMARDHCEHCPCPDVCPRWDALCEQIAAGSILWRRHACARAAVQATATLPPKQALEGLRKVRRMNRCEFRTVEPGCCAGARCADRGGAIVSHLDCFACPRLPD